MEVIVDDHNENRLEVFSNWKRIFTCLCFFILYYLMYKLKSPMFIQTMACRRPLQDRAVTYSKFLR